MTTARATPEGTEKYQSRMVQTFPSSAYTKVGRTGLSTSRIGFGTYRISDEIPEHREALQLALRSGCNLIDTSTNYMDGLSERCIGEVLHETLREGPLQRAEVIVVSKVGYVQGGNLKDAVQREKEGTPFPEVVKYTEECWHCIHPTFIEDQLTRSLERLGVETIDLFLLHNPEYYFSDAKKRRATVSLEELRKEFYQRIEAAFEHLEKEVAKGRIAAYGVSSNTFGEKTSEPEMTSLTRMWEIAKTLGQKLSGDPLGHHFSAVQLPLNLFENGPFINKNNGTTDEQTVLQFAQSVNLGVLVNRPLNAFVRNHLIRLSDFAASNAETTRAEDWIQSLSDLEKEFGQKFETLVQKHFPNISPSKIFRWSTELQPNSLANIAAPQWVTIEADVARPHVEHVIQQLEGAFPPDNPEWQQWKKEYLSVLEKVLVGLRFQAFRNSQRQSDAVSSVITQFLPPELSSEPLSRKSLAIVMQTPGVHCVLNGMRSTAYVEDSMGALRFADAKVDLAVYEKFSS